MIDLTGKWKFKEEFDYGKDEGIAEFIQDGDDLKGSLVFTERIKDEPAFKVSCVIDGRVNGNKIFFDVVEFSIDPEEIDYYPESREGIINIQGQIVGSSQDEQGVCGVFVMERMEKQVNSYQ